MSDPLPAAPRDVYWYFTGANLSPRVTPAFLARQRRLLLPAQYAREHENQWVDAADSFVPAADLDACMTGREVARGEPGLDYALACDIGLVHDPSVVGVGHRTGPVITIDRLVTLQGDRERPVQLAAVEDVISRLFDWFPIRRARIESWQGVGSAQRLAARGLPVEVFAPTAKAHSEEWPLLAQALANRTIVLPRHERLREELLGLAYEVTPTGIRVSDRGAVHQDHATVVRMLCAMLTAPAPRPRLYFGDGTGANWIVPPEPAPFPVDDGTLETTPEELAQLAQGINPWAR